MQYDFIQASALVIEICRNLQTAAKSAEVEFTVVLRGDSTLRGHFPEARHFTVHTCKVFSFVLLSLQGRFDAYCFVRKLMLLLQSLGKLMHRSFARSFFKAVVSLLEIYTMLQRLTGIF